MIEELKALLAEVDEQRIRIKEPEAKVDDLEKKLKAIEMEG